MCNTEMKNELSCKVYYVCGDGNTVKLLYDKNDYCAQCNTKYERYCRFYFSCGARGGGGGKAEDVQC